MSQLIERRKQIIRRIKARVKAQQIQRQISRRTFTPSRTSSRVSRTSYRTTPTIQPEPEPTPFVSPAFKESARYKKIQEIRRRYELARRYKQPLTMTHQQYLQKTTDVKRDVSTQKAEYYTMMEGIDPTAQYEYEGGVVTGATLKGKLKQEYLPKLEEAEIQSQLTWSQARDLPHDTTITRTKEGYEFKFRDTSLDWSKGEFKKIERAPHGVRQVAEFGFGAVSSFGALMKPIVLDPLIGTEKSRASHFVSPLDVAFEPVGWSPKGSTELMKSHPIFTAGGIGAEIVQSYAMTQALKPVSAGVKIGAKGFIKRVPSVYSKFSKIFPEEKFISTGVSGTKKFFVKGASELPKNIYKWGAKGYKKGFELTSAGVKTTSKTQAGKASGILHSVTQKTKYGRGGVKRVWLSPSQYVKAEKDVVAKLAMKKTVSYSPQARIKAGIGEASELFERTRYKLSWSGKRLVKKYGTTRQTWKIGKEVSPVYRTHKIGTKGSIERWALEGADVPLKESEAIGMRVYSKTGKFLGYKQPVLYQKHLPKKWISTYRTPFLKNIQAQTSVTVQSLKTKMSRPGTKLSHRLGLFPKLYTETVPSSMYKSVYGTGLKLSVHPTIKTVSATKTRHQVKPEITILQRTSKVPAVKTAQTPVSATVTIPKAKQVQRVTFKPFTSLVTTPLYVQERVTKVDVPMPHPTRTYVGKYPMFGVPWFPKKSLYGRGRMMYDSRRSKKQYRFRVFDVGDLFGTKKKKRKKSII